MIPSFADRGNEDIFDGTETRAARGTCPKSLWPTARRKLDQLNLVRDLVELAIPPPQAYETPSEGSYLQYVSVFVLEGLLGLLTSLRGVATRATILLSFMECQSVARVSLVGNQRTATREALLASAPATRSSLLIRSHKPETPPPLLRTQDE